jgi:hypothetical protein
MKKRTCWLGVLLGGLLFLASCIIAVVDVSEQGNFPKSELHRFLALNPGGTVWLENSLGDIEIRGWEKNEVEVFAEEVGRFQPGPKFQLWRSDMFEPPVDIDKDGDTIKIQTMIDESERESPQVNYRLNVPHSVNLRSIRNMRGNIIISDLYGKVEVDLREGDLRVENYSGSLQTSVGFGSVWAEVLDLRGSDVIKIATREGNIALSLQPEASAELDAEASGGSVTCDFEVKEPLPAGKVKARWGENPASISLSTRRGEIQVKKIK